MVIIITGAHKSLALKHCIENGVNHMWTLSALQLHPHPLIVVDEDATLELQVKTVKYFKSIEQVASSQGFEQILPSAVRTGTRKITRVNTFGDEVEDARDEELRSPTIQHPKPTTSTLLKAPATEYPVRSITPELVPDSMSSRLEAAAQEMEPLKVSMSVPKPLGAVKDSAENFPEDNPQEDIPQELPHLTISIPAPPNNSFPLPQPQPISSFDGTRDTKPEFRPPAGSWEMEIDGIDAVDHSHDGSKIIAYVSWKPEGWRTRPVTQNLKTGSKTQHSLEEVHKRCPQGLLRFYQRHIVFQDSPPEKGESAAILPPEGNWDDAVQILDIFKNEEKGLKVELKWLDSGKKTHHLLMEAHERAPERMLEFYEKLLVFDKKKPAADPEEASGLDPDGMDMSE